MLVTVSGARRREDYVKSPVASLCFACSSVRNRVRVTMSVFIFSALAGKFPPLVAMIKVRGVGWMGSGESVEWNIHSVI